jgi:hypothetical protein
VSEVPVRREVLEMPGGVMTLTVFRFGEGGPRGDTKARDAAGPGIDAHDARRPIWRRVLQWLSG